MDEIVRTLVEGGVKRWYIIPDKGAVTVVSGRCTSATVLKMAYKILLETRRSGASIRVVKDVAFMLKTDEKSLGTSFPKTLLNMGIKDNVVRKSKNGTLLAREQGTLASVFSMEINSEEYKGLGSVQIKDSSGGITEVWCTPDGRDISGKVILELDATV